MKPSWKDATRIGGNGTLPSSLSWATIARRHPSAFLLAAQLISLILYVAMESIHDGPVFLSAFGMVALLSVV